MVKGSLYSSLLLWSLQCNEVWINYWSGSITVYNSVGSTETVISLSGDMQEGCMQKKLEVIRTSLTWRLQFYPTLFWQQNSNLLNIFFQNSQLKHCLFIMQWLYISSQLSNVSQSHFMGRNSWIFLVQIYYKNEGNSWYKLKRRIVLISFGFDIRKQNERIQQLCMWNEHYIINCNAISSRWTL